MVEMNLFLQIKATYDMDSPQQLGNCFYQKKTRVMDGSNRSVLQVCNFFALLAGCSLCSSDKRAR